LTKLIKAVLEVPLPAGMLAKVVSEELQENMKK